MDMRSVALLALLGAAFASAAARAETYPAKPIRVVVSTSAGGITDVCARILGNFITQKAGQPVVIDNKPGGSGNIGMEFVAHAAPDGYTLGVANTGNIVINPFLLRQMPYDPLADLAPVGSIGQVPLFLVVNGKLPPHSLQEFIAYAKAQPGKLSYASAGIGTTPHLAADAFLRRAGLNVVHVPYRGSMPGVMDVLSGTVQMTFVSMGPHMQFVRKGDLRILAVAAAKRVPYLPDVPTFAEQGLPGFEASTWFALFAPRGTPAEIVERLNAAVNAGIAAPETRARLARMGAEPMTGTPADFAALIAAETPKWAAVVKAAAIKIE
jgi:tripartite-type tricarboxylate transporter receptor subunit TctC